MHLVLCQYNNLLLTPKRLCRAVLYSIALYLDYSKSLLRRLIDRTLSSLPAARPMGDSTRSDRCGSTLFASPSGRQDTNTVSIRNTEIPEDQILKFEGLTSLPKASFAKGCRKQRRHWERSRMCIIVTQRWKRDEASEKKKDQLLRGRPKLSRITITSHMLLEMKF